MLVIPRPDGMNNQLINVHEAIWATRRTGYIFVRPPIHEHRSDEHVPFETFFDTEFLEQTPVGGSFGNSVSYPIFEQRCGAAVNLVCSAAKEEDCLRRMRFKKRFARLVVGKVFRNLTDWTSRQLDCVVVDIETIHGFVGSSFGVYSGNYSRHQGWDVTTSLMFADTVAALVPVPKVRACAATVLGIDHAVHIRRGDYKNRENLAGLRQYKQLYSKEAFYQSVDHVLSRIALNSTVFVATNDPAFVLALRNRTTHARFRTRNDYECAKKFLSPNLQSLFEQEVCVHSSRFTGNRFSSWTSEVMNRRHMNWRVSDNWGEIPGRLPTRAPLPIGPLSTDLDICPRHSSRRDGNMPAQVTARGNVPCLLTFR